MKTSETRKRCLLGLISGVSCETRYIFQIFSFRVKFERSLIGYSKNAILSNVSILVDENPFVRSYRSTRSQSPPNRILTTFESRNHFRLFGESRWKMREKYKNSYRSETTLAKFQQDYEGRKGRNWKSKENDK